MVQNQTGEQNGKVTRGKKDALKFRTCSAKIKESKGVPTGKQKAEGRLWNRAMEIKAVYTAVSVACICSGVVITANKSPQDSKRQNSKLKKDVMDPRTDQLTNRPTQRLIESRARD